MTVAGRVRFGLSVRLMGFSSGDVCPVCGAADGLGGVVSVQIDGKPSGVIVPTECRTCGARWDR